jgi:hypothetical protein
MALHISKSQPSSLARKHVGHARCQMKTEAQILELLSPIYRDLGRDPSELVMIKPSYGGWLNALRFSVLRADNAMTWVSRVDIDAENRHELMKALRAFAH